MFWIQTGFFKAFRNKWVLRGLSPSLVVIITTDQLMGFTNTWARHSTNRPADCRAVLKLRLLFAHKCINRNVKKASKSDHKLKNLNKIYMAVIRILYTIQRTKKWSNVSISKKKSWVDCNFSFPLMLTMQTCRWSWTNWLRVVDVYRQCVVGE